MFSAMRKRMHVSPAMVIATLALVFAMTGGAYAASKVLITSSKQISPKVLKALKGANGSNGANGTQGAAGPAGPQGPAGTKGETGAEGKAGAPGAPGAPGAQGEPWTAGGTLPSGKTLTGEWSIIPPGKGAVEGSATAVSFALPLKEAPATHYIKAGETSLPAGCTGSVEEPGAEKGNLCVFASEEVNSLPFAGQPLPVICDLSAATRCILQTGGGGRIGFGIEAVSANAGEQMVLRGTWAVTAE